MKQSFSSNLRAQKWYNGEYPRDLSGYLNDKSNRLIGWATMRQLRIKSEKCYRKIFCLKCTSDYHFSNEDQSIYQPGWKNERIVEEYSSTIVRSFEYQSEKDFDSYVYIGEHDIYNGGGYVYEFRGRLIDIQSNLSMLHQLRWIDNQTRAIIIQLNLYNGNVRLYISVTLLTEFLSIGGI